MINVVLTFLNATCIITFMFLPSGSMPVPKTNMVGKELGERPELQKLIRYIPHL
jgi:hypothetical protein